ncbi:rod shape-determining protein MreC [Lacticaseibacillus brantae]|uniref:Cell shape-determining protein MreC n=1 Tax=Lacticaseibacillus brantae DSM 23927 TaxID=1423727 RepID=A0A0R2AYT9_9LACO|nr:rod shape-determining protein MreC [Lacticaseibacillus brantae]KRM72493.1 rod shape-determining protein MreC [Lacticaseibacillus brantae DSM 23927]
MQKYFSNKKLIVLMIAFLTSCALIAGSIAVRNNRNTPPLVQQIGNDFVGIGARVVTGPTNFIKARLADFSDLSNAYSENQRLKAQIDNLAETKVQVQTLETENKALKKQLKLNGTLTDYAQISAAVLLRSPSDWRNILVINRGSTAGIKKDMPVMSGAGLIGRIVEVNKTNSKVELLSTSNNAANRFAANVITKDNSTANGVITGYDAKSGQLILGQLNTEKTIKKGDKVATSGLGGATPKGLLIGTVTAVKKDDFGLANNVYIKPAGDLDDVSVVTVISRSLDGE